MSIWIINNLEHSINLSVGKTPNEESFIIEALQSVCFNEKVKTICIN